MLFRRMISLLTLKAGFILGFELDLLSNIGIMQLYFIAAMDKTLIFILIAILKESYQHDFLGSYLYYLSEKLHVLPQSLSFP